MHERIYVCHTFYHVYVTCLKELAIRRHVAYTEGAADRERLSARAQAVRTGGMVPPAMSETDVTTGPDALTGEGTPASSVTAEQEWMEASPASSVTTAPGQAEGSAAQEGGQRTHGASVPEKRPRRHERNRKAGAVPATNENTIKKERNNDTAKEDENTSKNDQKTVTPGAATLVLSKMSTNFGTLVERARRCGLFEDVIEFDEKRDDYFEELAPLRVDTGNKFRNMKNRIAFCKRFPELEAPFVPVDFRQYRDIYVFCDSDPIGYYLNANRIYYHAVEDGLNCLKRFDAARFDNRGAFQLKKWMAEQGQIFIQNGYAKYCLDMEVNDISVIGALDATGEMPPVSVTEAEQSPGKKPYYIEVPRKELTDALTRTDKLVLAQLFIENLQELLHKLSQGLDMPRVLVLTECILDEAEREKMFREIVSRYAVWNGQRALVMIKPHPRDTLDYAWIFRSASGNGNPENTPDDTGETVPDVVVLSADFPMEMLSFIDGLHFNAVVAVFTQTDAITFADEHISLAEEFAYAAPEVRQAQEGKAP